MKKILITIIAIFIISVAGFAEVSKHKRQTVYVPAYSHIYVGPKVTPFDLAITLSIRNTNANKPIRVSVADYYDSEGRLIKRFIEDTVELKPFGTVSYKVSEYDSKGGSGANFLVKWYAKEDVHPPIIESVMIGTRSSQGISFTSRGVVIED